MRTRRPRQTRKRKTGAVPEELAAAFDPEQTPTWDLIDKARRVREQRFGNRVHLCNILNAKSGACAEDCAFCSQSIHHRCSVPVHPLVTAATALEAARQAEANGARCFSLVTSGRSLTGNRERQRLLGIVETIRHRTRLEVACSLGLMDAAYLRDLGSAGLSTYHHNLETAPSHYDTICTTHSYADRVKTVEAAKAAGLLVCSGGIFGMGESPAQRAEFALLLKRLEVNRVPVNFLNPIPGTAMEDRRRLTPLEALHIVAALRITLPEQEILVCGGREVTLRTLQPLVLIAGANGIMTGSYLTTPGQGVEADHRMLADLELDFRPGDPEQSLRNPRPEAKGQRQKVKGQEAAGAFRRSS